MIIFKQHWFFTIHGYIDHHSIECPCRASSDWAGKWHAIYDDIYRELNEIEDLYSAARGGYADLTFEEFVVKLGVAQPVR